MDWTTPEGEYACISVCIHHVWVGVCTCTHLHANLGVCMPVCTLHECVIDVYIVVCVYTLCVCMCCMCACACPFPFMQNVIL